MIEKAVCSKCKEPKTLDEFYYDKNGKRRPQCKKCHYHPSYKKMWDYGLTEQRYQEILKKQGNHCAFCEETDGLEIDHNHNCCPKRPTCGKCTRGLLCDRHNRGIGFFTKEELEKALKYLEKI